jgi:hypothetical protein
MRKAVVASTEHLPEDSVLDISTQLVALKDGLPPRFARPAPTLGLMARVLLLLPKLRQ